MERGTIKWFDELKGYGFISSSDGKDYFVHKSQFSDGNVTPDQGQVVEFEIGEGQKGPMATNVQLLIED